MIKKIYSFGAGIENSILLHNLKVHHHITYHFTLYFHEVHFDIIVPSTPRYPKYPLRFPARIVYALIVYWFMLHDLYISFCSPWYPFLKHPESVFHIEGDQVSYLCKICKIALLSIPESWAGSRNSYCGLLGSDTMLQSGRWCEHFRGIYCFHILPKKCKHYAPSKYGYHLQDCGMVSYPRRPWYESSYCDTEDMSRRKVLNWIVTVIAQI
jgi:hypothetical protein